MHVEPSVCPGRTSAAPDALLFMYVWCQSRTGVSNDELLYFYIFTL